MLIVPAKQDPHTPPVAIRRWPESPPPPIGGTEVHGGRSLLVQPHRTLQLVRITAFEIGLNVHLALTVEGRSAVAARMQTRPSPTPATIPRGGRTSMSGSELSSSRSPTPTAPAPMCAPRREGCASTAPNRATESPYPRPFRS